MIRPRNGREWLAAGLALILLAAVGIWMLPAGTADPASSHAGAGESKATATTAPTRQPEAVHPKGEAPDVFADLRLERERGRSRREEMFKDILADPSTQPDLKSAAQRELWRMTRLAALEDEIEGFLRARGYRSVVVMLQDSDASIVIKAPKISGPEVAELAGVVSRMAGIPPENIRIYDKDMK